VEYGPGLARLIEVKTVTNANGDDLKVPTG